MSVTAYTPREELANSLTHGLGVILSVVGLAVLVTFAALHGDAWHITSAAVFGLSLVALYTASSLYHALRPVALKQLLRKFDHAAIFLLIAGSYTPFLLVTLRGLWGWSLLGVLWGLAVVGIVLKFWFAGRFRVFSTLLYLGMGWRCSVTFCRGAEAHSGRARPPGGPRSARRADPTGAAAPSESSYISI
jgi:hemolysin III